MVISSTALATATFRRRSSRQSTRVGPRVPASAWSRRPALRNHQRKWRALPIVGARVMLPELSDGSFFTGLVRYDVSFAGDPSKRNISNLQIAPTLNVNLPQHWFITFYPNLDIRINYGDPVTGQTGRLFLPMDFLIGRDLTKTITVSLEIGVPLIRDYPVYDFKAVTRLNVKF
jgi:hypothetical protein